MKSKENIVAIVVLAALSFGAGTGANAEGPGGKFNNHRGGQGAAHRSGAGSAHSNAQWSADPTHGWVRAGEQQELRKPNPMPKHRSDKGKAKSNGKSKGY